MAQKASHKKPAAKKAAASKKAAKTVAQRPSSAKAKTPAKSATRAKTPVKAAARPPAHKAAAHKPAAHKTVAHKPVAKTAPKHAAHPKPPVAAKAPASARNAHAKPAPLPPAPRPSAASSHAPTHALTAGTRAHGPSPAPGPLVRAAAAGLAVAEPPARKPSRAAAKYAVPQAPIVLPPPTSRFADRFSPPRPPTRQMNNLDMDVPKHAQKADPKLANAWKTKAGRDLTEAEILAMPESEYMNEKQLEFFRHKLQQLKDDLLSNAGETTEHLREDTTIVPDPADRATIEEEHALELRTRDRERKLLKKISQSLGRIDSGEYGFCDETGEPIGLGRLIARPTATLSLEAQQLRELKQKMFGD